MTDRRKKRPRDPIQLAKLIGDIATGRVEDRRTTRVIRLPLNLAVGEGSAEGKRALPN